MAVVVGVRRDSYYTLASCRVIQCCLENSCTANDPSRNKCSHACLAINDSAKRGLEDALRHGRVGLQQVPIGGGTRLRLGRGVLSFPLPILGRSREWIYTTPNDELITILLVQRIELFRGGAHREAETRKSLRLDRRRAATHASGSEPLKKRPYQGSP